jgi:hypothetical protein
MSKPKKHRAKKKLPARIKTSDPVLREPVVRREFKMDLPVPISPEEATKAGHAMVREIRRREQLDEERREAMAEFRDRRAAIDEKCKELADSFENGTKKISVRVREELIVETNEIQVIRIDTGEVVERRAAKAEDRQETLPLGEPSAATLEDGTGAEGAARALADHEDDASELDEDGAPT